MKNTFELKKGKLIFEDDKIIILDNAINKKNYKVFLLVLFLIAFSVITFTSKQVSYSFWWLLGIVGLFRLVVELLNSKQSEILLKEVKYLKIKRFIFREYLIIKLNSNKARVVEGILNIERLNDFIKSLSISQSQTF